MLNREPAGAEVGRHRRRDLPTRGIVIAGDRKGRWSLTVTGNWRITFELIDDEVCNMDLEDYH